MREAADRGAQSLLVRHLRGVEHLSGIRTSRSRERVANGLGFGLVDRVPAVGDRTDIPGSEGKRSVTTTQTICESRPAIASVGPDAAQPEPPRSKRLEVLDGWRAISILLVLSCHMLPLGPKSWNLNLSAGYAGMALFYTF